MTKGLSIHIGLNRVDPNHYKDEFGNPWEGHLAACEADAKSMQAIAAAQGLETQLLLTDQASSQAVVDAIKQAAKEVSGGDFFLITYAGHGGQVPDLNSGVEEEEDQMDETWCLFDRELIDDELYALWGEFEPGVRILMVSDSCHSGTAARDLEPQKDAETRVLPLEVQAGTYRENQALYDGLQAGNLAKQDTDLAATVVLLAGCQDDQVSYDGKVNGLFTSKLLEVWNNGTYQGDLPTFLKQIVAKMPSYQVPNYFQTGVPDPQFERQRPFTV